MIYLPILNNYSVIQFELFKKSHSGWASESYKEEAVGKFQVLTLDLQKEIYDEETFNLTLSLLTNVSEKPEKPEKEKKESKFFSMTLGKAANEQAQIPVPSQQLTSTLSQPIQQQ